MRNGQNKRMRGRNRKSHNPLTRVYELNGPDVKIRGTPSHIAEKYVQLARDAQSSGDPVAAENYNQHAEHYLRLIAAAQEQFRQNTPFFRPEGGGADMRDDLGDDGDEDMGGVAGAERPGAVRHPRSAALSAARCAILPAARAAAYGGGQPHAQQHHSSSTTSRSAAATTTAMSSGCPLSSPAAPAAPQGAPQGNGQNGYDAQQGDRFPLHRRRRRHRGPRDMVAGGGHAMSEGDDAPAGRVAAARR